MIFYKCNVCGLLISEVFKKCPSCGVEGEITKESYGYAEIIFCGELPKKPIQELIED